MLQWVLSRHLMVLVMLILAGIGWLCESRLDLFERFYVVSRTYETLQLDGLVPGLLLVFLGAFLDTYRRHQRTLHERERLLAMLTMAFTVAAEINDPLTTIIAELELAVGELHPESPMYRNLAPSRDAAWTIANRIKRLTELPEFHQVTWKGHTAPLLALSHHAIMSQSEVSTTR
jgi:hypothetical protein